MAGGNDNRRAGGARAAAVWVLVFAAVAAVNVALIRYRPEGGGEERGGGSSYSAAPKGTKALYTTLEKCGVRVSRKKTSMRVHPPKSAVLVMLSPQLGFDDEEVAEALGWLRSGGVLFVAAEYSQVLSQLGIELTGGDERVDIVLGGEGKEEEDKKKEEHRLQRLRVVSMSSMGRGVERLEPAAVSSIYRTGPYAFPHVMDGKKIILAERRAGKGRVIVFTGHKALWNENLTKADNLRLALNVLEAAGPGREVVFDEYRHGRTTAEWTGRMSFIRLLFTTPYGLCALLLSVAGVLWLFNRDTVGIAVRRPYVEKPSSLDHINAVAALHERMNAHEYAVDRMLRQLARDAGARTGVSGSLEKVLAAAVSRNAAISPADVGAVLAVEKKLVDRTEISAAEALSAARRVESIRRELLK